MARRKNKITGRFVPLRHQLIESDAFMSLSSTAKIAYLYFMHDIKNDYESEVILTLGQAKKYSVCRSPSTFNKAKRELVQNGLLDPVDGGGLNAPAIFKKSERWRLFGSGHYKPMKYKPGHGSKYFRTAMRDERMRAKILTARHGST